MKKLVSVLFIGLVLAVLVGTLMPHKSSAAPPQCFIKSETNISWLFDLPIPAETVGPVPCEGIPGDEVANIPNFHEINKFENGEDLSDDRCYVIVTNKSGIDWFDAESIPCQDLKRSATALPVDSGGGTVDCPRPKSSYFFGLPTWYKYLGPGPNCAISLYKTDASGKPEVKDVNGKQQYQYDIGKLWLIGLAIADMLLVLTGIVTVFIIVSGGYKYITSQFDPEGTKKAKDTILNGLIGLAVVVLATTIVNIIGNTLK